MPIQLLLASFPTILLFLEEPRPMPPVLLIATLFVTVLFLLYAKPMPLKPLSLATLPVIEDFDYPAIGIL
jgi:hypothetical protein